MIEHDTFYRKLIQILPGLLVCLAISILSVYLGNFVPTLGAATISIFLGILVGNTIGISQKLHRGTKFCESTLLSISVVLLGATLKMNSLLQLGIRGIIFILLQMIITIIGTLVIGHYMNFSLDFSLLMASGNSVCGSSAIASTAPVINTHSKDKRISITMVNVMGTVLMIFLPLLTSFLYENRIPQTPAMIGGILQSVGQVVASGAMISEDVKELATIYKILRIVFLVFVVVLLASIKSRSVHEGISETEESMNSNAHRSRIKIPWYVIGFFITCVIYSLNLISFKTSLFIKEVDHFVEIVALAGIGMRVSVADLIKQGPKTSLYCFYIACVQIISATILIWIFIR